jgi:murein endopeptidase
MLHPGQLVLIKKGDPRKAEEVRPFLKDWARLEPGQGYVIKRPDKNYGRPWAIALLRKAIADLHERYPDSSDVFVGDLSGPIGGRIQHHLSHKTGRDVDLAYFLKGNLALDDFVEATPETVDVEKSWQLIESCLRTDSVQYVFMDHGLQPLFRAHAEALGYPTDDLDRLFQYPREATTREGIIRHVKGHADHLHVRFRCPVDDGLCR